MGLQTIVKVLKIACNYSVLCSCWWFLQHRLDLQDPSVCDWLRKQLAEPAGFAKFADSIIAMRPPPPNPEATGDSTEEDSAGETDAAGTAS